MERERDYHAGYGGGGGGAGGGGGGAYDDRHRRMTGRSQFLREASAPYKQLWTVLLQLDESV